MYSNCNSNQAVNNINVIAFTHKNLEVNNIGLLHIGDEQLSVRLHALKNSLSIDETMFLSTCNRVEFVLVTQDFVDKSYIQNFLSTLYSDFESELLHHFVNLAQHFEGTEAVTHMLRVATSIDSMVVGEREIITQVRSAFENCSFTSLELTDNSALVYIDNQAFTGNKFSKIDLKNNINLTTIGFKSFADISNPNGTSLDLTGLTSLTSIGNSAFFNAGISGLVDFSGLSSLIDICSQAFDGSQNITQFKFFDNSGLNIRQNVYPGLSGDYSECPNVDLSLQWLDAGFTITNSAEHIWEVPN